MGTPLEIHNAPEVCFFGGNMLAQTEWCMHCMGLVPSLNLACFLLVFETVKEGYLDSSIDLHTTTSGAGVVTSLTLWRKASALNKPTSLTH